MLIFIRIGCGSCWGARKAPSNVTPDDPEDHVPFNMLMVDVNLDGEMKVLGLDERIDYARDIFGPSWLQFDELRYERARKYGTNTKIMSKPFEITEQKHEPGNDPSLMHCEAHTEFALSLALTDFKSRPCGGSFSTRLSVLPTHPRPAGTTWRMQDSKPAGCGLSSWTLQLIEVHRKMSCYRDWRKGRKARV